jgi:hypothetical protein
MRRVVVAAVLVLTTIDCTAGGPDASYVPEPTLVPPEAMEDAKPVIQGTLAGGERTMAASKAAPARAAARGGAPPQPSPADQGAAPSAEPTPARMVHYNGFLRLRVTNPTETLQRASEMADAAGGYVETLTATSVTLRVPVARFRALFAELAKIGDVLSRSMTAEDVTDAFVALGLRLETLEASRARLIVLLGKAKKTREKLRLLREIQRLTEEIDQLEMHRTTLASLASLSRLTVEAVPHRVHVGRAADEPIASFRWIHHLSPFSRGVAELGDRLELNVPEGFVALSDIDNWVAESADGAVIWTAEHEMQPPGTTAFWADAVRLRLKRRYGNAEVLTIGEFQVVRVVDTSEVEYRYLVGVRAVGDGLQVVEVYYPGPEQEERYGAAVRAVIEGGAR